MLGSVNFCDILYMYSPIDGSLKAIEITWSQVLVGTHLFFTVVGNYDTIVEQLSVSSAVE